MRGIRTMPCLGRRPKIVSPCVAVIAIFASICTAQEKTPGVTGTSIRIGSCSALSGPASFLGIQTQMGALAYFNMIDAQGGVYGRKIELKSRDDGYDPEKTSGCFNTLVKDDVFAM